MSSVPQAVTERKQHFSKMSFEFGRRLHEHLSGLFVQQVRVLSRASGQEPVLSCHPLQADQLREDAQSRNPGMPSLVTHNAVHQTLLPYSALLRWMRESETLRFNEVMEVSVTLYYTHQITMSCVHMCALPHPHRYMFVISVECMMKRFGRLWRR